MEAARGLAGRVGVLPACAALAVPRSSFYRRAAKPPLRLVRSSRPQHPRALGPEEREQVVGVVNSERFVDLAPREIYATLLDEGTYLCSVSTMYRLLGEREEVRERRDQLRHPVYTKPELLATGPNQLWSWDLTKLKGPAKWVYFSLYVILDVFSRYVVGWMVAHREAAVLAKRLIKESCQRQVIVPGQLTIHADRGSSMKSKTVAQLLLDLRVVKTHSRPHVSNDNPYSESQFKTLKYRPEFPERFGCVEDARVFCRNFFTWYNTEHHHSGIGLMSPEVVHYGRAQHVWEERKRVLQVAASAHPERFVRKPPMPLPLPTAVWINKPKEEPQKSDQDGH
jgi:putative transposase